MDSSQILDHNETFNFKPEKVEENLASSGKRFANLIIDMVAYILLIGIGGVFLELIFNVDLEAFENGLISNLAYRLIFPVLYFFSFEALCGKTLGKFITGTKVVTKEGRKPSPLNLLGRSAARLIPFDAFSFLSEKPVGWHDSLSNTRVINDR